jgi:UDP-N-acetylglucosamine transferase subunit ALG13
MLFVTIGNGKFEPLIKEIDRLKEKGIIKDKVIIQLGHGTYKPQHCKWFTFEPNLKKYYDQADLIISHGGPGTVFEILRKKKKLIAIPNRDRTDPNHQVEYLKAIAKETTALIYCDDVKLLAECIHKIKKHEFKFYKMPQCKINKTINEFLK